MMYMFYWSDSECPIGFTCEYEGKWNAVMVADFVSHEVAVAIQGTWNQDDMVDGCKATFCDQSLNFAIYGKNIRGSSSVTKYGSYIWKKLTLLGENTRYDSENTVSYGIEGACACLTDTCT